MRSALRCAEEWRKLIEENSYRMKSWRKRTNATAYEGSVHPGSLRNRERIFEYLGERSPGGVRNVMASIREAVTLLSDQPYSGYGTNDPDVLVKFMARYPYKIFYRVRGDAIEIAHIRHTSRRPWVEER